MLGHNKCCKNIFLQTCTGGNKDLLILFNSVITALIPLSFVAPFAPDTAGVFGFV